MGQSGNPVFVPSQKVLPTLSSALPAVLEGSAADVVVGGDTVGQSRNPVFVPSKVLTVCSYAANRVRVVAPKVWGAATNGPQVKFG